MVTSVIFLIKINLNRHIKHENLLSIYENMDYFQMMLVIVTCWKFQKKKQPFIKQGKSEGFESCDRPIVRNAQFGSKSVTFCPVWPWNLMDDLGKQ